MAAIGFIGLGNMGGPMAANLVKAGHRVTGFDLVPSAAAALAANGGRRRSFGRRGGGRRRNRHHHAARRPAGALGLSRPRRGARAAPARTRC